MSVLKRLVKIAKPYRKNFVAGLIFVVSSNFVKTVLVNGLLAALVVLVIGNQHVEGLPINKFPFREQLNALTTSDNRVRLLIFVAALTIFTLFIRAILTAFQHFLLHKFANQMSLDIRQRLYDKIVSLSPSQLERERTGSSLTRITADVVVLQQCIGTQLSEVLQAPITIIIALGCCFFLVSWKLTIITLLLAPLMAFLIMKAGRQIRKLAISIQERLADLNGSIVERLSMIRVIQSFVRERFEVEHVSKLNNQYYRETMRSIAITEFLSPGIEFLAYVSIIVGAVIGGIAVYSGEINVFAFSFFITRAQAAGNEFKKLSRVNQLRQQANGAGERILSLLDTEPEIKDAPDARELPPLEGRVSFENLSFCYATGDQVLSDINVEVSAGEVIALVGESGGGKTTLVNLLPRFYDPTDGRILLDGHDLREVTLASLREQVGIVPQETMLFSSSIYENILYGRLDATREEVVEAARAANALNFIERLPEGFDTVVGERGSRLSGGQRQRVAIARAILKNPRILILDEATSALDTESEHLVQQALDHLMVGRTTFVIAHRLSTVQHATRILVLDKGRIVEQGTHEELLQRGGVYHRLYDMQFHKKSPVAELIG